MCEEFCVIYYITLNHKKYVPINIMILVSSILPSSEKRKTTLLYNTLVDMQTQYRQLLWWQVESGS